MKKIRFLSILFLIGFLFSTCKKEDENINLPKNNHLFTCNYFPYTNGSTYIYSDGVNSKTVTTIKDSIIVFLNPYSGDTAIFQRYTMFNIQTPDTTYQEFYYCNGDTINQLYSYSDFYNDEERFINLQILFSNQQVGYQWYKSLYGSIGLSFNKKFQIIEKFNSYNVSGQTFIDVIKVAEIKYTHYHDPCGTDGFDSDYIIYNDTVYNYYSKDVGLIETSLGNWKLTSFTIP